MRSAHPLVVLGAILVAAVGPTAAGIGQPTLEWAYGGCFASWCETGWYSSPAVADLDGDGAAEVIASAYSVVVLDGATGALEWRAYSGHDVTSGGTSNVGRTWPGIVVADVDGDGALEIATAHGAGWISVYGDGTPEVVQTGNVYDCIPGYPSRYTGLYLFRPDRSRYVEPGADWSTGPIDTGEPLSEDYDVIESVHPDPVVAHRAGVAELATLLADGFESGDVGAWTAASP